MARQSKESSATPSTAMFRASLPEQKDYKNCFKALMIEVQRTPGLASDAKQLQENLAERKKADTTSKTAPEAQINVLPLPTSA